MRRWHWNSRCVSVSFTLGMLGVLGCCAVAAAASSPDPVPISQHHMVRGQHAFRRGDFEAAVQHWHEAARFYARTQQATAHRLALLHLSQAHEALGHYDRARQHLQTARSLAERANDREQLAAILANLGNIYVATGPWDKAEHYLREALEASQVLGDAGLTASPKFPWKNRRRAK